MVVIGTMWKKCWKNVCLVYVGVTFQMCHHVHVLCVMEDNLICQGCNSNTSFVIYCRNYVCVKFLSFGSLWVSRGLLYGGDSREGLKKYFTPRLDDFVVHVLNNEVTFHSKTGLNWKPVKIKKTILYLCVSRGLLHARDGKQSVKNCLTPRLSGFVIHVQNNYMNFQSKTRLKYCNSENNSKSGHYG